MNTWNNTWATDSFSWTINTTQALSSAASADVSFPCKLEDSLSIWKTPNRDTRLTQSFLLVNPDMLANKAPNRNPELLVVARRGLNTSSTEKFSALEKQTLSLSTNTISAQDVRQLDGHYILLIMGDGLGNAREDDD
jgi:hypothetical protein